MPEKEPLWKRKMREKESGVPPLSPVKMEGPVLQPKKFNAELPFPIEAEQSWTIEFSGKFYRLGKTREEAEKNAWEFLDSLKLVSDPQIVKITPRPRTY